MASAPAVPTLDQVTLATADQPPASPAAAPQPDDPTAAARLRRARRGFAGYDWANSGYITVVTTAVGGPFLDALANSGDPLVVAGRTLAPAAVLPATLVAAVLVQAILLPLLGRAVDRGASPARLIRILALLGGTAGIALALAPTWPLAAAATAAATICFGAAMVPYNALLPRLASAGEADRLSARAFATGYLGGGLLLAATLGMLTVEPFGWDKATCVRVAIATASLWWAGFALLACRALTVAPKLAVRADGTTGRAGVLTLLRDLPQLRRAIFGGLLLGDGVGAVVGLSAVVLTHELWISRGLPAAEATATLLAMVLLIQILAAPAAWGTGQLARKVGTKPVLMACLAGWVAVLTGAYVGLQDVSDVWLLAVGVAAVLGGSQTLSRSVVAQCTPAGSAGAVFGLTQLAERGTAWMGPAVFGVVVTTTGSYRGALLSLLVLFVGAALILARVQLAEGAAAAAGYDPQHVYDQRRRDLPDGILPTRTGKLAYALAVTALSGLSRLMCRVRIDGEPLPAGGCVVVVNHRSLADGPLMAIVGARRGRQWRMLGTAGVFTAPVLGRLLLLAGMVPVKRRTELAGNSITAAARLLRSGEVVALCPEGKITDRDDGLVEPLRPGAARLALTANVPLVVVTMTGAEALFAAGTWRPNLMLLLRPWARPVISVQIAAAWTPDLAGCSAEGEDVALAVTAQLHEQMTAQVAAQLAG